MRVTFFPSDLDGPGSYRCIFPALALGHNTDWDVRMCQFHALEVGSGRRWIVNLPPPDSADLFVVHRRFELGVWEWMREAQAAGALVVASTDDDDIHLPPWHSAHGKGQGGSQHINRIYWHRILEDADALIVSTPALAKAYRRHNPRSFVIKNYLDWRMWHAVTPVYERAEPKRLRVGWLGAPGLRLGDLDVLRAFLPNWLKRNPDVDFVSAGDAKTHEILGIPEGQRVTIEGIPFQERRLHEMLDFQIGLVPLAPCPFNEAKSHLKGLEYAAVGIPTVASPTSSYRDWLADGDIGLTANSPRQWAESLDRLVSDPGLRRRMGIAARARAEDNAIGRHWQEWRDVLATVRDRAHDRQAHARAGAGLDRAA